MTTFQREMYLADCRDFCNHSIERTDAESRAVRERAYQAAKALGFSDPEEALEGKGAR